MSQSKHPGEAPVTIMINRWERDLILRYGYPFEDIERQLKEAGDADLVRVTDSPYWWEQVIVNLGISEREMPEIEGDVELSLGVRALIERIADYIGLL
jgi:hypothetical protein